MKLVIDISDDEYEDVKKVGGCYYDFGKAIYYGTPLPDDYGRLIDANKVQEKINKLLKEPDYQHEGEDWKTGLIMADELIVDASTIIEADAETSEDDLDNLNLMLEDLWNATESEDKE